MSNGIRHIHITQRRNGNMFSTHIQDPQFHQHKQQNCRGSSIHKTPKTRKRGKGDLQFRLCLNQRKDVGILEDSTPEVSSRIKTIRTFFERLEPMDTPTKFWDYSSHKPSEPNEANAPCSVSVWMDSA